MTRVLLLVPARTYRATDFLVAANRLGLEVVVGSHEALPLSHNHVVRVEPDDVEASIDRLVAQSGPVDAIVAVDTPMLVLAAAVAARMGLVHNPVDAVLAASDKAIQRRRWAAAGVIQPAFRVVPADPSEGVLRDAATQVGFPCVVKAVSLSGSQGVLRADDQAGAVAAAGRIRQILDDAGRPAHEPLLVEAYVPGWELSIDGLLTSGELTVTAVFDKPDTPHGPTFEETVLVTPSRLPQPILSDTFRTAERAATTLGLRYGPVHAELRLDARDGRRRPTMLELAARSIGGLCSRALRFLDGVSLEELVLANALGRPVTPPRLVRPAGVLMLPVERAGVLRAVDGKTDAAAVPGVTGLSITAAVGQTVQPLPEGDRYLGFLFAEGATYQEVEEALRVARRRLRVVIQ
ncbi:MAG TPA: ATP-grasp domain-containing protein [Actinomycetes bacterium]|nr:ATP-grasp domain-containing protein [Actinomycetes bacterium]